jgi:predicted dehydrogenase
MDIGGRNIARTINETEGLELVTIFDEDKERVKEAKKLYNFKEYDVLDFDVVLNEKVNNIKNDNKEILILNQNNLYHQLQKKN